MLLHPIARCAQAFDSFGHIASLGVLPEKISYAGIFTEHLRKLEFSSEKSFQHLQPLLVKQVETSITSSGRGRKRRFAVNLPPNTG